MVNLAIGEILLPLQALLLIGSLVWFPGGKILAMWPGNPHLKHAPKV
jgi:hypothetical protein